MNDQQSVTILGMTNFRNRKVKFGIKTDDRRRHCYIIGKTGGGKTTLMENMMVHDIISGNGVGIIDPHGDFAEKLLEFVPESRINDVVYFNPADVDHPIGFNPLERIGSEHRHLVADGLMGVFKKIWQDAWSARMEYILNNTILALLEYPGSTLLGIMRMFSDKEYRAKIVASLTDPVIKNYWVKEYANYSQKFEQEATASIQNKVGQFISNPLIRNIIGQPRSAINMRSIMDEGKIFIANLSKGRIGEDNSALLGAMLITKMQLAAMSRVDIPEKERKDFFLYIDEFQNFSTDSFASILSEARKYRLSLILAHQYIAQLTTAEGKTKVRDAIFGNVGTLITFRVGAEDAEFLEKEFTPQLTAQDIVSLPKHTIYVKLMIDGLVSAPFSAETLPPNPKPDKNFSDFIIEENRKKYATSLGVVSEKIDREFRGDAGRVEEMAGRRNEKPLSILKAPPKEKNRPNIDTTSLRSLLSKSMQPKPEKEDSDGSAIEKK